MTERTPNPESRAIRGRFEIRLVIAVVAAIVIGGALYVMVFGSPNAENRERDSVNANPAGFPSGADAPARP